MGKILIAGILVATAIAAVHSTFAANTATSKVTLVSSGGNNSPTISAVKVNNDDNITLVANTTTSVSVTATVSDNDGCADINGGTSTILLYRSGVGSSTCGSIKGGVTNNLSCYRATAFTASSTCSATSKNTTTTFGVFYFADATDSSSSYPSQNWMATVYFTDPQASSTYADSSSASTTADILTLLAIAVTTGTTQTAIDYGTLAASSTTGSTNQLATIKNAGNSSTTLNLSGTALVSGANSIATTSQHYATRTFTFGGNEQAFQETQTAVSGFSLLRPPLDVRWTKTTSLPRGLNDHAAVAYNGYLYTTGGGDDDVVTTSTVYFAPISSTNSVGAWATTTPLPRGIKMHTAVAYNSYIYTAGGLDDGSVNTSTVYFAPISSTNSVGAWATTTPFPRGLRSHATVASNGYIYTVGGLDSANIITSTVYFAPISSTNSVGAWETTTPLPRGIRDHSVAIYNRYLYVVGGRDSASVITSTVLLAPISATNSVGTWATATPLPTGTQYHPTIADNGFLYTIGGDQGDTTSTSFYIPISATSTVGTSWATTTPLPRGIYDHSAAAYNGYVYVIGGFDDATTVTSTVLFTSAASRDTYWGLTIPAGTATGTYTGTNIFTAVFQP